MSRWTQFYDMHSGGKRKTDYELYLIEASTNLAIMYFKELTGRDPDNVTCSCCGKDYCYYEVISPQESSLYRDTIPERRLIITREDENFKQFIANLIG